MRTKIAYITKVFHLLEEVCELIVEMKDEAHGFVSETK